MKWQEQLPKWHPLHKREEDDVALSPGTERAIQDIPPQLRELNRELKKLNTNLEKLEEKIPGVKGIGAAMKKFRDGLMTEE